jgi:glycosyltransferase involved in cell wall biosynthesis
MRILYLHQYFNTPAMAGSTRSYEIGRRLVAAGHSVEMITSARETSASRGWFVTEEAGMRVHWLPVPYSNHLSFGARIAAFARFAAGAAQRAAGLAADVVFATSTPLTIALPAAWAAWRLHVPMVFEVRDLWPEVPIAMGALRDPVTRFAARRLEKFAYARAARVVALSPGMAGGVAKAGYPPGRIAVVPNAADLDLFHRDPSRGLAWRRRHGIEENRLLVAYMGTLGRANGVAWLVEVAEVLRSDSRFTFVVMGDGQERQAIENLARARAVLGHNFRMLPPMPKTEMSDALAATDIATTLFLPLPELEANSANKFFDGLAAGCCTAVNIGGWQQELLESSRAGIRLSRNPQAAALQLQTLADDPASIASAGRNARRLAEEKFSRDTLAAQITALLAEVVAEAAARSGGPVRIAP